MEKALSNPRDVTPGRLRIGDAGDAKAVRCESELNIDVASATVADGIRHDLFDHVDGSR